MNDATPAPVQPSSPPSPEIDPATVAARFVQESLPKAIGAAAIAAVIGAGIWAAVTVATERQIGWMAVGVGVLVGFAVRYAGRGSSPAFGLVGAGFALFGCVLGNLFSVVGFISIQESVPYFDMLGRVDPATAAELIRVTFSPMDLLFYAIAIYEGYKFSLVKPDAGVGNASP